MSSFLFLLLPLAALALPVPDTPRRLSVAHDRARTGPTRSQPAIDGSYGLGELESHLPALFERLRRGEHVQLQSPAAARAVAGLHGHWTAEEREAASWNYTVAEDPLELRQMAERQNAANRKLVPLKVLARGPGTAAKLFGGSRRFLSLDGSTLANHTNNSDEDSDGSGKGSDSNTDDQSPEYDEEDGGWYSDDYARYQILGACGAAYADDPKPCLDNTFDDIELYRNVSIVCDGYGAVCAAFIAIHHDSQSILVAYRGTATFVQLTLEVEVSTFRAMVESPIGGYVGVYFKNIFDLVWTNTTLGADVDELHAQYPDYDIYFVGHSLGGALATLSAAQVVASGDYDADKLHVITLGQPRTGDNVFAAAFDEQIPDSVYRIVNRRDVVSHVPPHWFRSYTHSTSEVWYPNGTDVVADEEDNDDAYKICPTVGESEHCSNQLYYYSVYDHLIYFGQHIGTFYMADCRVDVENSGENKSQ